MIRESLADKYIRGRGIEIGGRHCPLSVPRGALVAYIDRLSLDELKNDPDVKVVENEIIIDDAEKLDKIEDSSLDFIIANHVFEHTRNPLGTLEVWHNRLRTGGIVYAAIPEKTQTFDATRSVTEFDHLIKDYQDGPETDDEEHYREWFSHIDKLEGDVLEAKVKQSVSEKANIHFHVWDRAAIRELWQWTREQKMFELVEQVTNGGEEICILRAL